MLTDVDTTLETRCASSRRSTPADLCLVPLIHITPDCAGFGTEITGTGVYIGEYNADQRSGAGELLCGNGDYIEGNFVSETR